MSSHTDDNTLTSPLWDTCNLGLIPVDPGYITLADYLPEGMRVVRNVRAVGAGVTLKFRTASTWRQKLPGGTFDPDDKTVTRTFAENEAIEGVQITQFVIGSFGTIEVLP